MDISPFGITKNTFSSFPQVVKTAILATLGYSHNTEVQDALTEIIAVASRPVMSTPHSILASQKQFNTDFGIWGRMWISKIVIPGVPEAESPQGAHHVGEALAAAINALSSRPEERLPSAFPAIEDVEAEWTGYRSHAFPFSPRPNHTEREHYESLMAEVKPKPPTILYLHGGAFCLMDPSTHRWTTSALAQETGGRCLSVRYRLSPQAAFPAALIDALLAYLYLIHPPRGAFHDPVDPAEIVIAGDSSGACLAASLLLLLLTFRRVGVHRMALTDRAVTLPPSPVAGLALTSPWLDVSRALPSVTRNARYDIIAPPIEGAMTPNFPADSIWPTNPPRVETYCDAHMVAHPLVSPLAATPEHWKGAPPVYVNVGWEGMQDEAEAFCRRVAEGGGLVRFEGFVGMPHCFGMVPWCRSGRRAFEGWSVFCSSAVKGELEGSAAMWVDKYGKEEEVEVERLGLDGKTTDEGVPIVLDDETVDRLMKESRAWRVRDEKKLRNET